MLNKDDILSKIDLKKEKITVPEWGGDIFVSEMTADARDQWEQDIIQKDEKGNLRSARAKLLIATVCDEKGNLLFSPHDVVQVGKLSAKTVQKIIAVAQRLNGLGDEDIQDVVGN